MVGLDFSGIVFAKIFIVKLSLQHRNICNCTNFICKLKRHVNIVNIRICMQYL